MPNINGKTYGLTILSPINNHDNKGSYPSPVQQLRNYLNNLPSGTDSPLTQVPATHFARFTIIDEVFFEGFPNKEDHLKSPYLCFTANFDGLLDPYLESMFTQIPGYVEQIWQFCYGFPGIDVGVNAWKDYMKKCQVDTTFFFAAVNDMSVDSVLRALMLQTEFTKFVIDHQGADAASLQQDFVKLIEKYKAAPTPHRASVEYRFAAMNT